MSDSTEAGVEEPEKKRKIIGRFCSFLAAILCCFAGVQRKQWMKILQRNLMVGQSSVISVCVCVWVALIESDMIPKQTYFSGRWSFKEN